MATRLTGPKVSLCTTPHATGSENAFSLAAQLGSFSQEGVSPPSRPEESLLHLRVEGLPSSGNPTFTEPRVRIVGIYRYPNIHDRLSQVVGFGP